MDRYERILLATDLSEVTKQALAEATRFARHDRSELHVLHVDVIARENIEGFGYPELRDYVGNLEQTAMGAVGKSAAVNYKNTVTAVIRDTSPATGIVRYAREKNIDLIVLGSHGRSPLPEALIGSVAQQVAHDSPVSVMVAGPGCGEGPRPHGVAPVMAAVDFSPASLAALAQAGRLAAGKGAPLIVIHAVDFERVPDKEYLDPDQHERHVREQLASLVAASGLPGNTEAVVRVGDAAREILKLAQERAAGLIVLAPSHHSGLERLLLGAVCRPVIRSAPCPVLIHREPTRETASAGRKEAA